MRKGTIFAGGLVALSALLTACSSGSGGQGQAAGSGKPRSGGTATFAWLPDTVPNYILPFDSASYYSVFNMYEFQQLMYRPLYLTGVNGQPGVSSNVSLAYPPSFSNGNRTVTVRLRDYKWSNGKPVTADDVAFFHNLTVAEKTSWGGYSAGAYPDNVTSVTVNSPREITFHLNRPYAPQWFWDDELTLITPMPPDWDKTSSSAKPGSGGCDKSVSKCKAVYSYLSAQAKNLATYAKNPLWQVVDGPWRLASFNADGNIGMVPNKSYSGPVKPKLDAVKFVPFTSDTAEYNALISGSGPDVGYIPASVAKPKGQPGALGALAGHYMLNTWYWWGIDFVQLNYLNPDAGPIFKQLYVRQALQHVVDQQSVIKGAFKGYGYPTNGPVPIQPANSYASALEKSTPYPFSITTAHQLLAAHGWKVVPNGVSTCVRPGTGQGQCGAGIPAGAKLSFSLEYANYGSAYEQSMNLLRSNALRAGIKIQLKEAPFNTVLADGQRCQHGQRCTWQMLEYGGYSWRPYPTGQNLFASSAGSNHGDYADPTANRLINQTTSNGSPAALQQYQDYLARQLPVIWQPMPSEQLTVINPKLRGVTPQNPLLGISPENWYYTS